MPNVVSEEGFRQLVEQRRKTQHHRKELNLAVLDSQVLAEFIRKASVNECIKLDRIIRRIADRNRVSWQEC